MCFFCPISNAKQCGASCGLCGESCPGAEPDGLPNGMDAEDYDLDDF